MKKEKITAILYKNSTDCSEGLMIKFENIQKVIDLLCESDIPVEVKPSTVLLTTEDSVEVTDKEQLLYGISDRFTKHEVRAYHVTDSKLKHFATEAARDEYIFQNKPITTTFKEYMDSNVSDTDFFKSKQSTK